MALIQHKRRLNPTVTLMEVSAPLIAKKAQPGQFIILRVDEHGERIPLTISDYDRERGTVTIIFQKVGLTTELLDRLEEGDDILDFVGPLGTPTDLLDREHPGLELGPVKRVAVIGGGVGCAIAYPQAKYLHARGVEVDVIAGFRSKDIVILEEEFKKACDHFYLTTDDGSCGEKGLVTDKLKTLIDSGIHYDAVIAIGPIIMMKFVCKTTEPYGVPTTVSMSPIMIDGTGMCGGCRLSVGGEMKFACVDGPDFDGHKVDWDLAVKRNQMYRDFEAHKYEETCNLFKKEAE